MGIASQGGEDGQRAVLQCDGDVVEGARYLQTLYRGGITFFCKEVESAVLIGHIAELAAHVEKAAQRTPTPLALAALLRQHHVRVVVVIHVVRHILQFSQRPCAHAVLQLLLDGVDGADHVLQRHIHTTRAHGVLRVRRGPVVHRRLYLAGLLHRPRVAVRSLVEHVVVGGCAVGRDVHV